MGRRTEFQLALLVAGVIVWGYGARTDVPWLQYTGIGFFAVATLLRFAKRRDPEVHNDRDEVHEEEEEQ